MADEEKLNEDLESEVDDQEEATDEESAKQEKGEGLVGVVEGIQGGIQAAELDTQIKVSFLDYAMSTITARALPDARDGMKPVQRRIIYGMAAMGITPDKPYKKSARIVGDVMGRYHPHGDSSIYMAMARMAQNFALRMPLVDGHGNFGSQDGDDPAAYRYTEARLNKLALEMVRDINRDTVNFTDTYDGDGREPVVLPSRIPNLIVNGAQGIAVGMATNIPSHNLGETFDAIIALMRNSDLTPTDLMRYIKGPDFPGGGIICGRAGIRRYFETGLGSVKVRGRYEIKEHNGHTSIVFTEVPYMVNKKELAKKIMELVDSKVLEGIQDIADYSDGKHGTVFQIDLRKDANPEIVVNHLFKYTQLQVNFAVDMLALDDGTPKVLNMKQALQLYINFQREVIRRRTVFNLKRAQSRIHIIDGLLIAVDNIDEAVRIIRSSKTQEEAFARLMERFSLDEAQTKAILDMTLRRLTGLEKDNLVSEREGLLADVAEYQRILNDSAHLDDVLIGEMEEIKAKYADPRRTEISDNIASEDDEDLIDDKAILIALTRGGYIKRMDTTEFKTQNRGGIGISGMTTKEDDEVDIMTIARTKVDILFFTNLGRIYRLRGYQIPEGTRTSKGIPVINLLPLGEGERVLDIISHDGHEGYLTFVTVNGLVKRTAASEFENINRLGKIAIGLREGDELFGVLPTDGHAKICISSSAGKMCMFDENDVRPMGRTATGVIGMNLAGATVVGFSTSLQGDLVLSVSANGFAKMSPISEYRETARGTQGVLTMRESERSGKLVSLTVVKGDEDVLVTTDNGTVMKTTLTQIKTSSRATTGVILVRLREGEKIASVTISPSDKTVDEEGEAAQAQADSANSSSDERAAREQMAAQAGDSDAEADGDGEGDSDTQE